MFATFNSTGLASSRFASLRFLDALMRGLGQVMLQNNAYTGALFLLGIGINSGVQALGVFFGAFFSTLTAQLLKVNPTDIQAGLHGFNGALVGLAISIFLLPTPLAWLTLALAAAFSTLLTLALTRLVSSWQLPAFTAPYVLISWCLFLSQARFGRLESTQLLPTAGLPTSTSVEGVVNGQVFFEGLFNGLGQVFFQANLVTAGIFLLALLINSRPAALVALLGSLIGLLVAWLWGASALAIGQGAFGFNGVLVGLALITFWPKLTGRTWALILLALAFTPVVYAALSAALEPLGMPALTFAFVLVTWVMLLAYPTKN